MSQHEDERLPRELLEQLEAREPHPGFAARVVARARPRARLWRWGVAGAALAAMAAAFLWLRSPDAEVDVHALTRTTWNIGGRAVAVGETGATLRWRTSPFGGTQVVQSAGDIFYRVHEGATAFEVQTPLATVTVTGTCFRVEVLPMSKVITDRKFLGGTAVGALAAAAVLVTVYEGEVRVVNAQGRMKVAAGEAATVEGEGPPVSGARPSAERHVTGTREAKEMSVPRLNPLEPQAQEIERLRARVRELEGQTTEKAAQRPQKEIDFVNPSKEELLERAKECRLEWDSPGIGDPAWSLSAAQAEKMGLQEGEREVFNNVRRDFVSKSLADLRRLYVEVTGHTQSAETLSAAGLQNEIVAKSPEGEVKEVFKKLSAEKAGLIPASAAPNASPLERMMRTFVGHGDGFEQALAVHLGPTRARELRMKNRGWSSKNGWSYGCPNR